MMTRHLGSGLVVGLVYNVVVNSDSTRMTQMDQGGGGGLLC